MNGTKGMPEVGASLGEMLMIFQSKILEHEAVIRAQNEILLTHLRMPKEYLESIVKNKIEEIVKEAEEATKNITIAKPNSIILPS